MFATLATLALVQGLVVGPAPIAISRPVRPVSHLRMAESSEKVHLERFLGDLEFLGPVRFVVQGPGAILEAIGSFENLR